MLVGCEESGVTSAAFRARGHTAWSCDLLPTRGDPRWHLQCDVRAALLLEHWDLFIVHPDCRYLTSSGLHWNGRVPGRQEKTEEALAFVREMLDADVPRIALENPQGCISTRIRPADQYIQPWQFGHPHSKKTGLWLKNLPQLKHTSVLPLPACGYWENQTPSRQNKLGPSPTRARDRAVTYRGWAEAMADQWGSL